MIPSFFSSSPSYKPFPIIHSGSKHQNILQVAGVTLTSQRPARTPPVCTHVSRSRRACATPPPPWLLCTRTRRLPACLPACNFARRLIHAALPLPFPPPRSALDSAGDTRGGRRGPRCCSYPGGTGRTGRDREDGSASRTGAQRPGHRENLYAHRRTAASPQRSCSLRTEEAVRVADRMAGARCLLEKPG